jgi:hypothetical protein
MRAMLVVMVLGFAGFVGLSTSNGCGTTDNIFDCQAVCERYRECFKADYDVGMCRDRCRSRSESDSSVRAAADQCAACIDDKSCLSGTFSCAGSCGVIVP